MGTYLLVGIWLSSCISVASLGIAWKGLSLREWRQAF